MEIVYILLAMIVLLVSFGIFQAGRIYESCVIMRDTYDELEELKTEFELLKQGVMRE